MQVSVELPTPADVLHELSAALLSLREVEADLRGAALLADQCPECPALTEAISAIFAALSVPREAARRAIETCLVPGRPLILVVDDAASIGDLLRQVLEERGYNVIVAPDGRFAVEFVRLLSPALILLDLMMSNLDGPAFLQVMKQTGLPLPPVVVLTALSREEAIGWLEQVGRADVPVLTKPFHLPDLLARISASLVVPMPEENAARP